jgi:CRP-like cAMP-binding protein
MSGNTTVRPSVDMKSLRAIYLFSAFDDEQLSSMLKVTERIFLEPGQRLFNQGDEIRRFYYVESGQMKLYRLSAEGYEKVIDLIGANETFAEAVVFMERHAGYPVNADALEPTHLLGFDAQTFLSLLRQSNESCLQLMAVMSRRLRWQLNEIDRLALQNATSRFVDFVFKPGDDGVANGKCIELSVPKNILASRLSIKPETFSRILARLSTAGLIKVDRQSITLLDVDGLRRQLKAPD